MPSRPTRRLLPVLALSLTLSLTAVGTTNAGEAPDRDAPSSASPATGPAPVDPAAPAATLQTTAFTAGRSCTRVPAGTHPEAPEAVTACVSVESSPAKAGTLPRTQATSASAAPDTTTPARSTTTPTEGGTAGTRSLAAEADEADDPAGDGLGTEFEPDADDPEPPAATCQVTNPGTWTWSRTGGMCLNGAEVTYKLLDSRGVEIGSGLISVNSTLSTSYKSLDVTETITAKVIRVTGDVQSLTLRMQVGCGTGCTTVTKQPWYATTLSYNGEVTGKTKYRGDPFATGKTRVSFRTNYAMYVTMPGANPVDSSATWSSPAGGEIRCDAEQPRLRGCVIPTNDLPVLSYSRSHEKYGIVVPIYEEIMRRRGTDILHAVDLTQATANRNATCTPFTNLYPTTRGADSCDEFPPASTKEGGQDGSLCAELTPQVVNNVWSAPATWPNRPTTGTETCLRLHITQRANSSAGGVLGSLRKYQRLVTDDPFRIEFTS